MRRGNAVVVGAELQEWGMTTQDTQYGPHVADVDGPGTLGCNVKHSKCSLVLM